MSAKPQGRYAPETGSPNAEYPPCVSTGRHRPCARCGHAGYCHDRARVHEDGMYHYELHCPEECAK